MISVYKIRRTSENGFWSPEVDYTLLQFGNKKTYKAMSVEIAVIQEWSNKLN